MTTSTSHSKDSCRVFNTANFQASIAHNAHPFIRRFSHINRSYVLFHLFFIALLSFELMTFALMFSSFLQTTVMAFWLAAIFLSVFTYLVLLFYLQGRRPEKLELLRNDYLEAIQQCIPFAVGTLEYHSCITEAIFHLIGNLRIEQLRHRFLRSSETFSYLAEKFFVWTKWKDMLKLKEMLLLSSIEEHIRLIKKDPADLEAHASLANNYLALSSLYEDPKKLTLNETLSWTPPEYDSAEMGQKFAQALERALEEYHIIDEYAPKDPWVHAQRATLYRKLKRPEFEQMEYEKILEIDPHNHEILFRLGKLYFQKGQNAKGLRVYDLLQDLDEQKAHDLIEYYDAYTQFI